MNAVLRDVWFGRVWRANACRVIEEREDVVVLWFPPGAPGKVPVDDLGRERRIPAGDWTLADRPGRRPALALLRPGRRWSLWHFWEGNDLLYWYVNFERDTRRTPLGVDQSDEKLDLVVYPDGRVFRKDEDELNQAAGLGLVDAAEVRAEAEQVLAAPPWPSGWEQWRPDPGWELPALPAGWDVVES